MQMHSALNLLSRHVVYQGLSVNTAQCWFTRTVYFIIAAVLKQEDLNFGFEDAKLIV